MNLKAILLITVCLISVLSFSQTPDLEKYFDTLFYEGGVVKPCYITKKDDSKVLFIATTKKGIIYKSSVNTKNLEYYVDYDDSGKVLLSTDQILVAERDSSKFEYKMITDTLTVYQHHLSINPIALGLLGIDFDYMVRLKKNPKLALNCPIHLQTLFGNTFYFHSGIGMNYIPFNFESSSFYVGAGLQYHLFEYKSGFSVPVKFGFIKKIGKRTTLHGSAGAGPLFTQFDAGISVAPELHLGIGFTLGNQLSVTNTTKKKVWKDKE